MTPMADASQIVACALRPEGSLGHLATLVGFVLLARWLAPAPRPRRMDRTPQADGSSSGGAPTAASSARSMQSPSRSARTS